MNFADEHARYANRRVCSNQSNEFAIRRQHLYRTVVIFIADDMNLALSNCARRYVTNKTDGPNLFLAHGAFVVLAPLSTERVFHN